MLVEAVGTLGRCGVLGYRLCGYLCVLLMKGLGGHACDFLDARILVVLLHRDLQDICRVLLYDVVYNILRLNRLAVDSVFSLGPRAALV